MEMKGFTGCSGSWEIRGSDVGEGYSRCMLAGKVYSRCMGAEGLGSVQMMGGLGL